jgi:hypothetical protein
MKRCIYTLVERFVHPRRNKEKVEFRCEKLHKEELHNLKFNQILLGLSNHCECADYVTLGRESECTLSV